MIMERKVGEIFEYNGEWYQCVECDSCGKCSLRTTECGSGTKSDIADEVFGACSKVRRTDNKHAIFKKLEKVGGPHFIYDKIFKGGKVYVQNFMVYEDFKNHKPICDDYVLYDRHEKIISIEIKQNKEDMEEKKLNLKEFDLEAAKAGKPVCTRDGRKARIICFDAKCNKPIVALIYDCNKETVLQYLENGRFFVDQIDKYDLMMFPQKKEGWVNVYKSYNVGKKIPCMASIYPTKEEAKKSSVVGFDYVDTVKIEWEE
jgi:hypothetical protein